GDPRERIGAGGSVVLRRRQGLVLPRESALRRPGAYEHGAAAFRPLAAEIAGQGHVEVAGRLPQQLPADAEVVLLVDPAIAGDVEDRPPPAGGGERETRGKRAAQRSGDRRLGLLEAEVADGDLRPSFEIEGRLAGGDVDRPRR